ncbi:MULTISPECIES: DUF1836 domain-containing protein [Metabacillus]|jgi:hypothetical protein|uniref:DUF1836 domain-containing protein n=3 Tax=Metabacillus TaxID=2675233 RepID=A0A179SZ60_9BACI|nr:MULTISPECIES: DUF1836 domain-containing protein [Metabacillus]OAS86721.1 hypothetical protein A6K24_04205 [Metabacillus litoralis]QNF29210.1 DUF1836 domain-containing protein [Metabacillus sp. KUDC1714]
MMPIQLTRKQMTNLLYSLKGESNQSPSLILEHAIGVSLSKEMQVPTFLLKTNKRRSHNQVYGLSTNEIVSLANLCELTSLKSTSIQNWIKRDIKELIGTPELGKKYSIEQAAMLLIVRDLKTVFDFEKIRNLLTIVFNTLSDRSDDLISPIIFYEIYATVLDSLEALPSLSLNDKTLEKNIVHKINTIPKKFSELPAQQWEAIRNVLVITVLSVLASHLQTRAQVYLNEKS